MSAVHDAFLELPLDGIRLIEASAGTGKTFTLATLVTRLVIERGLRVGEILAVTYTEAARRNCANACACAWNSRRSWRTKSR